MPTVTPSNGFRYYGKLYNTNHGAPAFQYIYDSGVVWLNDAGQLVTGAERPVTPDDLGSAVSVSGLSVSVDAVAITGNPNVTVSNTAPIPVSGVVQATVSIGNVAVTGGQIQTITTGSISATVDTSPVVFAIASGNNLLTVANQLNSGISGLLVGNLTDPAYVTGAVSITNTAPIPVSGVTQANVTNTAPIPISGNVVSQITGWNTGSVVTVAPRSSSVATNYGPSGASPFSSAAFFWGQALAANPARLECFLQNVHTGTPLYVNLGASAASTGSFSMILNPSTMLNWGGSSFGSSRYKGAIQVSGAAWVAWEI